MIFSFLCSYKKINHFVFGDTIVQSGFYIVECVDIKELTKTGCLSHL